MLGGPGFERLEKFGFAVDAALVVDMAHVRFSCGLGHAQLLGNVVHAMARDPQREYLGFTGRQVVLGAERLDCA